MKTPCTELLHKLSEHDQSAIADKIDEYIGAADEAKIGGRDAMAKNAVADYLTELKAEHADLLKQAKPIAKAEDFKLESHRDLPAYANTIKRNNVFVEQASKDIESLLEKAPQEPVVSAFKAQGARSLTEKEKTVLAGTMTDAEALGLPKDVLEGIVGVMAHDIGLGNAAIITNVSTGDTHLTVKAGHLSDYNDGALRLALFEYLHETWHIFDNDGVNHGDNMTWTSHDFRLSVTKSGKVWPVGKIAEQAYEAYNRGGEIAAMLKYPLSVPHVQNQILQKGSLTKGANSVKAEVFAQLGALWYTNPKLLKAEVPAAYALFEEIANGFKSAKGLSGHRDVVLQSLRARGSAWDVNGSGLRSQAHEGRPEDGEPGRVVEQGNAGTETGDQASGKGGVQAPDRLRGAVSVEGIHYGTTKGLAELSGEKYGTGASLAAGEESKRLEGAASSIRQRTYFYNREAGKNLPTSEGMVTGSHVYRARLEGILDPNTPEGRALMKKVPRDKMGEIDGNAFEQAVIDAGYRGYTNRGQTVVLGRNTPAEYLGNRLEARKAIVALDKEEAKSENHAIAIQQGLKPQGLPKSPTVNDLGQYFNEVVKRQYGRALDPKNPDDVKLAAAHLAKDFEYQLKQVDSGLDWYSGDIKDAWTASAKLFPVFEHPQFGEVARQLSSIVTGLMSPATKAHENWHNGMISWNQFEATGKFAEVNPENDQIWGVRGRNIARQIGHINDMVADPEFGVTGTVEWMLSEHTGRELEAMRLRYGRFKAHTMRGVKLDEKYLGVRMFGPKVGPFVMNLNGIDALTMDVWATRTMRRIFGTAADVGAEGEEPGPTDAERKVFIDMVSQTGNKTGHKSQEVQSVVWFFEQSLYNKMGAGSESHTFSEGAQTYADEHQAGHARRADGGGFVARAEQELADGRNTAGAQASTGGEVQAVIEDFNESPEDALQKPGWAVVTATREALGAADHADNIAANAALDRYLQEHDIESYPVKGYYKGVDQGSNRLIFAPAERALDIGRAFGQESILTNKGLVYSDGRPNTPALHDETVVGPKAKEQDFYSELPDGTAFAMGLDWSEPELKVQSSLSADADAIAKMDPDKRDNTETQDFPGRGPAYNLYEARKMLPKPSEKIKRVTDSNSFNLWQDYDAIANVDGKHYGVSKFDDPDAREGNVDEDGNQKEFVYAYTPLDNPGKMVETQSASVTDLIADIRNGGQDYKVQPSYNLFEGVDEQRPGRTTSEIVDGIQKFLAPAARGPIAHQQAGIMRDNLAQGAQRAVREQHQFQKMAAAMNKRSKQENYRFINDYETGRPQPTPELQAIADALHVFNERYRIDVQNLGTGKLQQFDDNYLGRIWKDRKAARAWTATRRPLEGSKGFLKARTFQYFVDGLNAGLEPLTDNPIEMALIKGAEISRYIYAQRIIGEMHSAGLTQVVPFGERGPEGWTRINDKIAQAGSAGFYWAPDEAATLINNHLSPGMQGNVAYDIIRKSGMMLNSAQLGLSAFHLGFTTLDAMVSKAALGAQQLSRAVLQGDLSQGAKGLGNIALSLSPTTPFTNLYHGDKLFRAYLGNSNDPMMIEIAKLGVEGGMRVQLDAFYKNATINAFRQAVRRKDVWGTTKHLVPTILDKINAPIFEYLVPRQKLGVFFDMARDWLERNPNASLDARRSAAMKMWDSVDNRMGQLAYDNVFWNRALKDALMISVRSVGWNLGTYRELGGGVVDANPKKVWDNKEFSTRTGYIFGLTFVTAMMGAVIGYLYTGHGPRDIKDLYAIPTGRTRPDGTEDRIQLPSYMKDVYAYQKDASGFVKYGANPFQTVMNKMHPLLGMVAEMVGNKDFFGGAIRSPGDPAMQQLKDEASFVMKQISPFGVRNYQQAQKTKGEPASVLGYLTAPSNFGITPAPGYLTKSDAQIESSAASMMKDSLISKFRQELRDGGDRADIMRRAINAGLRPQEIAQVARGAQPQRPVPQGALRHFGRLGEQ